MRYLAIPCILAMTFIASLQTSLAQGTDTVSLQFVSIPRVAESQPLELLLGEGKSLEVQIPSNELSPTYSVPRAKSWIVGKTQKGGQDKSDFTVFGKGKSIKSDKQLVLLLRRGPLNSDGFKMVVFDNSSTNFGGRKFLFVNASNKDLAGKIGGIKFGLKPGMHYIVAPKDDQGADLCHAELFYSKETVWKPFFSSNWPLRDGTRSLVFIYGNPQNGHIKLHTIEDFL